MRILILAMVAIGIVGCSSQPTTTNNQQASNKVADIATPDQVLSRIDNLKERPTWLKESEPFKIDNGMVYVLGKATIGGDDRIEAAYRIAENNAKIALSSAIEQRLDSVFQNAEEGTGFDKVQSRYIGSEATKLATSSIQLDKRYWEKYSSVSNSGERILRYDVFSYVKMPEADFKRAIIAAANKRQGKAGLSPEFKEKVEAQWDRIVNTTNNEQVKEAQ